MTGIGAAACGAATAIPRATNAAPQTFTSTRLLSPNAEQDLDRQLIEPFVTEPALTACAELGDQALNLGIGVPSGGTFPQDQVGAHAAACEVADAVVVFGAVGVGIE